MATPKQIVSHWFIDNIWDIFEIPENIHKCMDEIFLTTNDRYQWNPYSGELDIKEISTQSLTQDYFYKQYKDKKDTYLGYLAILNSKSTTTISNELRPYQIKSFAIEPEISCAYEKHKTISLINTLDFLFGSNTNYIDEVCDNVLTIPMFKQDLHFLFFDIEEKEKLLFTYPKTTKTVWMNTLENYCKSIRFSATAYYNGNCNDSIFQYNIKKVNKVLNCITQHKTYL